MAYSLRSIVKGSTVYTAGYALTQAMGFFLIPVYTRYLTPEDYGIISILGVVVSIGTALLSLGLYQAQTRYYHEYSDDPVRVGRLLFTVNVLVLAVAGGACMLLTVAGEGLFSRVIRSEAILFVPFVVIALWNTFFNVINQLVPNFFMATKRFTTGAALQFARFLITVSFIIFFVVARREGALGSVKGVLFGHVAAFVLFYWLYARHFVPRLSRAITRNVLSLGLPVMVHTTAVAIMVSVDKLILKAYLPLSSVGIYNLGHKFGLVMSVVVISINRAWMPNYYELMNQDGVDRSGEIRRAFAVWLTVVGTICIVGSSWARDVIEWVATPGYYDAWTVVPVILVAYMFQGVYFFMGGPIFYFKKTHVLPFITVGTAVFNVGLNTVMIPRYGIMGAAFTNLASFALLAAAIYLVGRRYFDPRFDLWRASLLLLAAAAGSLAARYLELSVYLRVGAVVGYLLLCIAVFPGYLIPLVRKVMRRGWR